MRKNITIPVFFSGAVAVVAQTFVVRESIVLSAGSELIAGLQLGIWLALVGAGSIAFRRPRLGTDPAREYAVMLGAVGVFFLTAVLLFRLAPALLRLPAGEAVAPAILLAASSVIIAPVAAGFGALFPAAGRLCAPKKVYSWEAAGAALGGLAASFLLIGVVPAIAAPVIASSVVIAGVFIAAGRQKWTVAALVPLVFLAWTHRIEFALRSVQARGQDLAAVHESKYGFLAVTKTGEQYNFFSNGVYDFSSRDPYRAEEAVHYAMLVHPAPARVLLIGGGYAGGGAQVLKHPGVENLVCCELDPALAVLAERFAAPNLRSEARVRVIFGDARYYIKRTEDRFDVAIVNLPDPVNGQINRYYTREFFGEVRRILRSGGVMSLGLSSPAEIIGPRHAEYLKTVQAALAGVFADVLVLPAARMTFVAGDGLDPAPGDPELAARLAARIRERNLALGYVNEHYLRHNLSEERIGYAAAVINRARAPANRDLNPVCYFYSLVLRAGYSSGFLRSALVFLYRINGIFYFLPLLAVAACAALRKTVYAAVFCTGATAISLEIVLIVMFQAFHGYLYGWIGVLLAAFMGGLAAGSMAGARYSRKEPVKPMMGIISALAGVIGLVIVCAVTGTLSVPVFLLLLVAAGLLTGGCFPFALECAGGERAAFVYGADVVGSAGGAVLTALVLIPVKGIVFALVFYALLSLVSAVSLFAERR